MVVGLSLAVVVFLGVGPAQAQGQGQGKRGDGTDLKGRVDRILEKHETLLAGAAGHRAAVGRGPHAALRTNTTGHTAEAIASRDVQRSCYRHGPSANVTGG
jgi:hypothetical protein